MLCLNPILSLCQAGLFSGTAATFIVQVIQSLQPDPTDVTNVLLLRILQQNTSFSDGADPLAPPAHPSRSAVAALCILFACLVFTFAVAMLAVVSKWMIYYLAQRSKWAGIGDELKKFQLWVLELGTPWLYNVMAFMGVVLENVLIFFIIALVVFLWDFNTPSAVTVLVIALLSAPWLAYLVGFIGLIPFVLRPQTNPSSHSLKGVVNKLSTAFLNPDLWRKEPLLGPSSPKDIVSSAGAWLLENGDNFSATTAVAAMFSEFQWPLRRPCHTALIRLRDTYEQCFRAPKFDTPTRLNALQTAAAYYVLYHTQLIRGYRSLKSPAAGPGELPRGLPVDLFRHERTEEWGGDSVFEYLLRTEDRSEPVTSAHFLSYIAPYWFCGDSDSSFKSRPSRLEKMHDLVDVLDKSEAFTPATLTNCVLCVGAAMDFPLHPEDLVRVDKRCVRSSSCQF